MTALIWMNERMNDSHDWVVGDETVECRNIFWDTWIELHLGWMILWKTSVVTVFSVLGLLENLLFFDFWVTVLILLLILTAAECLSPSDLQVRVPGSNPEFFGFSALLCPWVILYSLIPFNIFYTLRMFPNFKPYRLMKGRSWRALRKFLENRIKRWVNFGVKSLKSMHFFS